VRLAQRAYAQAFADYAKAAANDASYKNIARQNLAEELARVRKDGRLSPAVRARVEQQLRAEMGKLQ
jgi:hypothetical protein